MSGRPQQNPDFSVRRYDRISARGGAQQHNGDIHGSQQINDARVYSTTMTQNINQLHNPVSGLLSNPGSDASSIRDNLMALLAYGGMDSRSATIKPPYRGTCRWLYDHDRYRCWRDRNSGTSSLWIKGNPGSGKSTIMTSMIAAVEKELGVRDRILSFFFNARGRSLERSAEGIYRSLLHQLLTAMPPTVSLLAVRQLIPDFDEHWPVENLEALSRDAIRLSESDGEQYLYCFIDGLDECDETALRAALEFLDDLTEESGWHNVTLKLCLASRHHPHISIANCLDIALERDTGHDRDVELYVRQKLQRFAQPRLIEQVITRASGGFLWADLVIRKLRRDRERRLLYKLETLLDEVPDELYDIFCDIVARPSVELRLVLQFIIYARRPMRCEELYNAVPSGVLSRAFTTWDRVKPSKFDMEKYILSCSRGLVEFTRPSESETAPVAQFIHETVRESLNTVKARTILGLPTGNQTGFGQDMLAENCLTYTLTVISRLLPDDRQDAGRYQKWPFLPYAVRYLVQHAERADRHRVSQSHFVARFPAGQYILISNTLEEYYARRRDPNADAYQIFASEVAIHLCVIHMQQQLIDGDHRVALYRQALDTAIGHGTTEEINELFSCGSQQVTSLVRACDLKQVLTVATERGSTAMIDMILRQWKRELDSHMATSLLTAAKKSGSLDMIRYLWHKGARVVDDLDIMLMAIRQGSLRTVEMLIPADAAKAWANQGRRALLKATEQGAAFIVAALLEAGAGYILDYSTIHGAPLRTACRRGDIDIARLLLANQMGLHNDILHDAFQEAMTISRMDIMLLLLDNGAVIEDQTLVRQFFAQAGLHSRSRRDQTSNSLSLAEYGLPGSSTMSTPLHNRAVVDLNTASGPYTRNHKLELVLEESEDRTVNQLLVERSLGKLGIL